MFECIENFVSIKQKRIGISILYLFSLLFSQLLLAQDALLIKPDTRPTDLEYALMSSYAYKDDIKKGDIFGDLPNWVVHKVETGDNRYKGVVFKNTDARHMVVAHRGTNSGNTNDFIANIKEDVRSIVRGKTSPQELEAFKLTKEMAEEAKNYGFDLSFTGHSLGAFLAELSVFFCSKGYHDFECPEVNAVTFESPGIGYSLKGLQSTLEDAEVITKNMDILGYVSNPNLINTLNSHIGSLYAVEPELDLDGSWVNITKYTLESHTMNNLVKHFKDGYENNSFTAYYLSDWPKFDYESLEKFFGDTSGVVKNGIFSLSNIFRVFNIYSYLSEPSQREVYFKYHTWDDQDKHYRFRLKSLDSDQEFDLTYNAHYQIEKKYNPRSSLPLKHFNRNMQKFLAEFYYIFWKLTDDDRKVLLERYKEFEIPKDTIKYLLGFQLEETKRENYIVRMIEANGISLNPSEFRRELSEYLSKNKEKIIQWLSSVAEVKRQFSAIGILLENDAVIGKLNATPIGRKISLSGLYVDIEQALNNLKKLPGAVGLYMTGNAHIEEINQSIVGEEIVVDITPTGDEL